jgi:hypothetical protein
VSNDARDRDLGAAVAPALPNLHCRVSITSLYEGNDQTIAPQCGRSPARLGRWRSACRRHRKASRRASAGLDHTSVGQPPRMGHVAPTWVNRASQTVSRRHKCEDGRGCAAVCSGRDREIGGHPTLRSEPTRWSNSPGTGGDHLRHDLDQGLMLGGERGRVR